MINSFMQQKFNDKIKSTDSVKSLSVMIQLHTMDKEVNLELWDLPGRGDFIVLNRMYLRDTNAALRSNVWIKRRVRISPKILHQIKIKAD